MIKNGVRYRMYWEKKSLSPPNGGLLLAAPWGEARSVSSYWSAKDICDEHNRLFPCFHHWFEAEPIDGPGINPGLN